MQRTVQESFQPRVFADVNEFVMTFDTDAASSALQIDDACPIQMKWFNRDSDTTFVVFSAAITRRAAEEVPVFSGWGTTKHLPVNVLMISDPSLILDTDLNLSWYVGSEKQGDLVEKLTLVLRAFSRTARLVLFGASGGGFAALVQASRIPGATALVSNPQTDITKFSYYPEYVRLVWSDRAPIPVQTEVLSLYRNPVDCDVIYIQNSEDSDHMDNHLSPFQQACHPDNRVLYLTPDLTEGHIGPAPDSFKEIFSAVTSIGDFNELSAHLRSLRIYSTKQPKNT